MEPTKKVLNIAIAFSIVTLSLSFFIYSIRDSKALAAPQNTSGDFVPVGIYSDVNPANNSKIIYIVGYNAKTNKIKGLQGISYEDFTWTLVKQKK